MSLKVGRPTIQLAPELFKAECTTFPKHGRPVLVLSFFPLAFPFMLQHAKLNA
jgi:hypothetical protein